MGHTVWFATLPIDSPSSLLFFLRISPKAARDEADARAAGVSLQVWQKRRRARESAEERARELVEATALEAQEAELRRAWEAWERGGRRGPPPNDDGPPGAMGDDEDEDEYDFEGGIGDLKSTWGPPPT